MDAEIKDLLIEVGWMMNNLMVVVDTVPDQSLVSQQHVLARKELRDRTAALTLNINKLLQNNEDPEHAELKSIINNNYGIAIKISALEREISALRKLIKPPCKYCCKDGFACEGCEEDNNYRGFEKNQKDSK